MSTRVVVMFTLASHALACGGGDDGADGKGGTKQPPIECSAADRTGTYAVTYTQTSGDCGPIASQAQKLKASYLDPTPANCVIVSESWSTDECDLFRAMTCTTTTPATGTTKDPTSGTTTQTDALGATFEGDMLLERTAQVGQSCQGTYTLKAIRQGM